MKGNKAWIGAGLIAVGILAARAAEHEQHAADGAKKDAYPLETCVVSGEKLGSMGKPHVYEIRFCCPHCVESFVENPKKYIDKLEAAKVAQRAGHAAERPGDPDAHAGHQH